MRPHPILLLIVTASLAIVAAPASAQLAQGQAAVSVEVAAPDTPVAPDHLTTLDVEITLLTDLLTASAERHAQVELTILSKPDWMTAVLSPEVVTVVAQPEPGSPAVAWHGRATLVLLADQGGAPGDVGEIEVEARVRPQGLLAGVSQASIVGVERGEGACVATQTPEVSTPEVLAQSLAAPAPPSPPGAAVVVVSVSTVGAPVPGGHLAALDVEVVVFSDPFSVHVDRTARVELTVLSKPAWATAVLAPEALAVVGALRDGSLTGEWRGTTRLVLLADQGGAPGDEGRLEVEARVLPGTFLPEARETTAVTIVRGDGGCLAEPATPIVAQAAEPDARVPAPALAAPLAAAAAALVLARRRRG